jgi:hypothetical protein
MIMARQRFSFVSDEVRQELTLEARIRSGEINAENFHELSPEEQAQVNAILFRIASDKVNPNQGASVLEFILMAHLRLMQKKLNGLALSPDEQAIEASLNRIMEMHEMTNPSIAKADWLFDYMEYAERKAEEILRNRKEHIERKRQVMGEV